MKAVKWICLACGNNRKIPSKGGHKIWWDQPEAVRCVFDYGAKANTIPSKSQNESSKTISAIESKKEVVSEVKDKSNVNNTPLENL